MDKALCVDLVRDAPSAGKLISQVLWLPAQKAFGIDYLGKPVWSEEKGKIRKSIVDCVSLLFSLPFFLFSPPVRVVL